MTLIIEIALGIVLGAFLLWLISAIASYEKPRQAQASAPEPTVWLVKIGGLTKCILDEGSGCCRDMLYDPALANSIHQFATYDEAREWAKEMVNVDLGDNSWEAEAHTYWHGNLEVVEVTPTVAARYMEHRTGDGKVDPAYTAAREERWKTAQAKQDAEKAAHLERMRERRDRAQNLKT